MRKIILFQCNKLWVYWLLIVLFEMSCSSQKSDKDEKNTLQNERIDTSERLAALPLCAPISPLPDTCPLPKTILVPTRSTGQTHTLWNGSTVKMDAPKTVLADFFVSMQNFNTEQGLALSGIACAYKDRLGNLWFGTYGGGISKYDGKAFTNYTTALGLANNHVLCITEDRNGNLWFGTAGGGVSKYDGISFTNLTTAQGLPDNTVLSIEEDKIGNLWFGTAGGGVCKYNPNAPFNISLNPIHFTTENGLANNNVLSIVADKMGNLWFGTAGGGLSKYEVALNKFSTFTKEQGLASNTIWSITEDRAGYLWLGSIGGGISKYNPSQPLQSGLNPINFTTANGLGSNSIYCITQDKRGNLWFGTNEGGVSQYDSLSGIFTTFTTKQGLANNTVWSITEDNAGNLWFGTFGAGLSRYNGKAVTIYTTAQGLPSNQILSVMQDKKGNHWFGTYGGGVVKYDGKNFTTYSTAQGLPDINVFSVMEDKNGDIWLGTDRGGVIKYDGKSFINYTIAQGLASNTVFSIEEDKEGNLWFGTIEGGVSKFDRNTKRFTNYTTAQGLVHNNISVVMEDKKGNIWIGSYGGGLSIYNPSLALQAGSNPINLTTAQGLSNDNIASITEDREGNIWICTLGGGLDFIANTVLERNAAIYKKDIQNLSVKNGLADDNVYDVIEDKEGNIIIGTNLGFTVLVGGITNDGKLQPKNEIEYYNEKTAYPVKDMAPNALFMDDKGLLWAGTADKLVCFDYKAVNKNTGPPTVIIQSVKINNENISWNNLKGLKETSKNTNEKTLGLTASATAVPAYITEEVTTFGHILSQNERDSMYEKFSHIRFDQVTPFYPLPINLILPYRNKNITFEYAAVEPSRPHLVKYQYILEGYDEDWSPVTHKMSASFGNIHEGSYTFKLKAQSPEGVWSEPISYSFKVRPPWYRSWWIYIVYISLLGGSVVALLRWNGRRLIHKSKVLAEEVRKATLEIIHQKEMVEIQKKILEEKNYEITDSINYALRIQQSILPDKKEIQSCFPQSFILYKPKAIVSGDFYFFTKENNKVFIAAADCTGHGVPGAFMSMVGSQRLSDAVQQSKNLSEILLKLNVAMKASLHQTDEQSSTKDGMDIAICSLDLENYKLHYAAANRPLWIIRKNCTEIEEIKPTKASIGGLTEDHHYFESHEILLQQGDSFYLFSDGYADQFGGEKNKKLSTKKLKEILVSIQSKSLEEQEKYLYDFIENWKGENEQIDDILLIGIRV